MCVSEDLKQIAIEYGIHEEKVSVIPIGVDIDVFKKKSYIKPSDFWIRWEHIILYVGRIVPEKGLDYLNRIYI